MAEVVGVVGSAVGITGFAFQIADGIKKLMDFCQAVKDAPSDLHEAISELEDLAELYQDIGDQVNAQQQMNAAALPSQALFERILARCRRNCADLEALLVDMDAEVKKRRTRASIKVVLKKETFAKFQKRVERTKNSLQLSYTAYCRYAPDSKPRFIIEITDRSASALNQRQTQSLHTEMQKISASTPQISAMTPLISVMAPQLDMLVTHSTNTASQSTYQKFSRQRKNHSRSGYRTKSDTVCLSLRLPWWLLNRTYELAFSHSTRGWDASFRVYNIVPSQRLYHTFLGGDYESIKSLLAIEPAHVLDQDERGLTSLHVGVCCNNEHDNMLSIDIQQKSRLCYTMTLCIAEAPYWKF